MLEEIKSYEAKTKFPELLRRIEQGEELTITKHGKAIADIVPSRNNEKTRAIQAIKNILSLKKNNVSDAKLKTLKESGRK